MTVAHLVTGGTVALRRANVRSLVVPTQQGHDCLHAGTTTGSEKILLLS